MTLPAWIQQIDTFSEKVSGALSGDLCDGLAMAERVYGPAAASPQSGLLAFAYCWRRFGPPWFGSDDHKELVKYILGT